MIDEDATLTCSRVQATDETVAAESRATPSDEYPTALEARFRALTATSSRATDSLARKPAEVESLTHNLVETREAVAVAGGQELVLEVQVGEVAEKHQEMSSVREEATASEEALKVELTDLRKTCSALRSEREQSSEIFRGQWELREVRLKEERGRLQERAEQLSGDVLTLRERLAEERIDSGDLAEEVYPA